MVGEILEFTVVGDGVKQESNPARHLYEKPGSYEATVTVRDARSSGVPAAIQAVHVDVTPAPDAAPGAPKPGAVPLPPPLRLKTDVLALLREERGER